LFTDYLVFEKLSNYGAKITMLNESAKDGFEEISSLDYTNKTLIKNNFIFCHILYGKYLINVLNNKKKGNKLLKIVQDMRALDMQKIQENIVINPLDIYDKIGLPYAVL
jgi:hypothetical protein